MRFAIEHRLPTLAISPPLVGEGILLAYGVNGPDLYRRAGTYVDKILRGTKPGVPRIYWTVAASGRSRGAMPMSTSTKVSAGRVRSTYEFIKANRDTFSVQAMCRVLGVAPSGYYEWFTQGATFALSSDFDEIRAFIRGDGTPASGSHAP